ncbi:TetR/AcrR family transcriptional regulator [Rhodococcus triatomae]|nr:TetR family transcriptional regulator [Rhodococcus triatomae BKS 15-14]
MTPRSRAGSAESERNRGGRPTAAQAGELDRRIRHAALDTLLEHGYEATSMKAIADAAGTTKPTLYTRFPTKEALFLEVLGWAIGRPDWPVPEPPEPDPADLEGALTAIAHAALTRTLHPDMIRLEQIAIGHAAAYPDLAKSTYGTGTWPRKRLVVELLTRHARTGAIVADDPGRLAELFLGLASGVAGRLASFGIVLDADERDRHLNAAVQLFLRSLRPD